MARKNFSPAQIDNSVLLSSVARNIGNIKRERKLTLAQLSEIVGLSERYIHDLIHVRANITVLVIENIATALDVSPIYLLSTESEQIRQLVQVLSSAQREA
jgi:transcriptional regulator with XRE-family HTH domain